MYLTTYLDGQCVLKDTVQYEHNHPPMPDKKLKFMLFKVEKLASIMIKVFHYVKKFPTGGISFCANCFWQRKLFSGKNLLPFCI